MVIRSSLQLAAMIAMMAGLMSCSQLAPAPPATKTVHQFQSAEQANRAIEHVAAESTVIEQRFEEERTACLSRFLTTACIDAAMDRRRSALAALRDLDVQARAWLRKDRVDKRDAALARRRADDEREERERAQQVKEREAALERKRISSEGRQRDAAQREGGSTGAGGLKTESRLRDKVDMAR